MGSKVSAAIPRQDFPFSLYLGIDVVAPALNLASATNINDTVISLTDSTGYLVGNLIGLFNADRFFVSEILAVDGGTHEITIASPVDYAFPTSDTYVASGQHKLTVDGSTTIKEACLRSPTTGSLASNLVLYVSRIIITMTSDTAISLNEFGGLNGGDLPTKGIQLRYSNGRTINIGPALKTNLEIKNQCYDSDVTTTTNPAQGLNSISFRWTFGGDEKMGSFIKVGSGDTLCCLIQDDLSGSTNLTDFKIIVQGFYRRED